MTSATFLDGRVTLHCEGCKKPFSIRTARLKHGRGKYCSPACKYEAAARPRKASRFTCIGCGTGFHLPPSKAARAGGGKYCTRVCRDKHWTGPNNPNWQNGDRVYKRGSHWHAIRRRIIARDKVCQHCGAGGPLHVHHALPFRLFADQDAANAETNLIALCPPCHRREDARSKWVPVGGGVLRFNAGSEAWKLARERGMV